jgi:hypothetical protein
LSVPAEASPTLEVCVWYEAEPADDARVRAAVDRLVEAMVRGGTDPLHERPRLLRRPETTLRDGVPRSTWMEVWPAVPRHALEGWLARLDTSARDAGATLLARGGRHVEVFEPQPAPRVR